MKKTIAVVGFGFMGTTHTLNILKNASLRLTAIIDNNPENVRKNLGEQSGNFSRGNINAEVLSSIAVYSDLADYLKVEKPDAVAITVHTDMHYSLTKIALEAGVNVFLEKPFSLNIQEAEQLISLAKDRNLLLMIGHVVRFMPAYLTLKNWIESKSYGNLLFLSLSRFSGIPAWGQWKERQKYFGSSGGALFDLVIHDIDYAQWVCGKPLKVESRYLPGKLSNYDYLSAFWEYENGLSVKIEGGNIFHTAYPFHADFAARFEQASILYSSKNAENIIVATDTETTLVPAGDAMDGFSGEMNYFAECLISRQSPVKCTPESALDSIIICYQHINIK